MHNTGQKMDHTDVHFAILHLVIKYRMIWAEELQEDTKKIQDFCSEKLPIQVYVISMILDSSRSFIVHHLTWSQVIQKSLEKVEYVVPLLLSISYR